jgi:DNA-directed RNA polymerase specialized sigma24 family protein
MTHSADFLDSPAFERDLSDRLKDADPEAIALFFTRIHDPVFAETANYTADPDTRRDWTHAILAGLADDLKRGRFEWLQAGSFRDWCRRRAWFRLLERYLSTRPPASPHDPRVLDRVREQCDGDDPLLEFEHVALRVVLQSCIDSLVHEHHRRALSMLLLDGSPYRAVAGRMGVPLTTIHRWVRRARFLVRRRLAEALGFPSPASEDPPDDAHDELQRLVLVSESLHDDERAAADAHRDQCATCRELLDRVRNVEAGARLSGTLPAFDDVAFVTIPLPEARRSLELLLKDQKLAAPAPAKESAPAAAASRTRSRAWMLWVPAGVVVAVLAVALWPRMAADSVLRAGTRVIHAGAMTGRSPAFVTGDPFALEFELARPARLIVAHVAPDGNVELLVPDSSEVAPVFPAGRQRVPAAAGNPRWTFAGRPGRDAFVVVAVEGWGAQVTALRNELTALPPGPGRLAETRRRIAERWGPVQVIEVKRAR